MDEHKEPQDVSDLTNADFDTLVILGKETGLKYLGTNFPAYSPENALKFEIRLTELVKTNSVHNFKNPEYGPLLQEMRKDLIKVIKGSDYGRKSFAEQFEKSPEWHMAYFIPDILRMDDPTKGGPPLCTHIRGMGNMIVMSFLRKALDGEPVVSSRRFGIRKRGESLHQYDPHSYRPPRIEPATPTNQPLRILTD